MHISKEQRCHFKFSIQLILAVSYFCRFKPKGPWLNSLLSLLLPFQVFFWSLDFFNSLSARSLLTLHMCFRTFDFPAFSLMSLFSVCSLKIEKKTTCRTDLSNIMPQSKEPYRHPMEVMLSHCVFQSSTCCSFTISVSITDFSIQTQMKRIRDMRAW